MHSPEGIRSFSSGVARSAVVALAAVTMVLGVMGPANAVLRPAAGGLRLAALGDSGSSGEGAGAYFRGTASPHGCHRSPHAWPFQLARQTPHHKVRKLTRSYLVACSGAGSLSAQIRTLKKLRPKPGLVTITMGWDASGIGALLKNCAARNCVGDGKLAAVKRKVPGKLVSLAGQFLQVRSAGKGATVLLVGYPQFIATSARCTRARGFSRAERRGLNSLISELDADINAVAAKTGLRYVAVTGALGGHELCTGRRSHVSATGHPKTAGQQAVAKSVGRYINAHHL